MTDINPDTLLKLLSFVPIVILFYFFKFFFDFNRNIRKDYKTEIDKNKNKVLMDQQIPKMITLCEKALDILSDSDLLTIEEILYTMTENIVQKRIIESVNKPMVKICQLTNYYNSLRDLSAHLGIIFLVSIPLVFIFAFCTVFKIFEDFLLYFFLIFIGFFVSSISYLGYKFFKIKNMFDYKSDQISLGLEEV